MFDRVEGLVSGDPLAYLRLETIEKLSKLEFDACPSILPHDSFQSHSILPLEAGLWYQNSIPTIDASVRFYSSMLSFLASIRG